MRTEKAKEYELKTNKENILSATYNLAKKNWTRLQKNVRIMHKATHWRAAELLKVALP